MNLSIARRFTVSASMLTLALLGACASGAASAAKPGASAEEGVTHQVTPADLAALSSDTPIKASEAELWVNGMGCPQCVTNVDLALERLPGVASTRVDLGAGKVYVGFTGDKRPSPRQMHKAVDDAGNTLVKMIAK